MAEDSDIKDLQRQIGEVLDALSVVDKNATHRVEGVRDEVAALRKQVGDPKEIAELKARVKELETKLGKMGKK